MNVPAFLPAIWLFLAAGIARAQPLDEAKPYGRAAVTVVDAAAKSETLLTAGTLPGSERFVTVHLDASAPCEALVAAFAKKDGRLAFGSRSARVRLASGGGGAAGVGGEGGR